MVFCHSHEQERGGIPGGHRILAGDKPAIADGDFREILRRHDSGPGLFEGGLEENRDRVGEIDGFFLVIGEDGGKSC
jgi:hypothetical protein